MTVTPANKKMLITIPLCDYESITTRFWFPSTTRWIVTRSLGSLVQAYDRRCDLVILHDRCSPRLVRRAADILQGLRPQVYNNSDLDPSVRHATLPEKHLHIINQFLRAVELAWEYELLFYAEQDYFYKPQTLLACIDAFDTFPTVGLLSPFDHPDRHRKDRESLLGHQDFMQAAGETWKTVTSTNGFFMLRMSMVKRHWSWLHSSLMAGHLDYGITNGLYKKSETLICPVRSLAQHIRLDGSNASPTFGICWPLAVLFPFGLALRLAAGIRKKSRSLFT